MAIFFILLKKTLMRSAAHSQSLFFFHEKSMKMCVQLFKKGWSKNSMSFAGPAMSSRQPSLSISANMLPIYLRHLIVYLWHLRT